MVQIGDIVFTFTKLNPISEIIAAFIHTALYKGKPQKISHAEMVIGFGEGNNIKVMSADATGLNEDWVIPDSLDWYCIKSLPSLTVNQRQELVQWMVSRKGTGYDFLGLADFLPIPWLCKLSDPNRLFCSDSVFKAYQSIGINLLSDINYWLVDPVKLYISPLLQMVAGK